MEMGNQESYFLYHKVFSGGKQVIDDRSYRDIYRAYRKEEDPLKKKELADYLCLGTLRQKKMIKTEKSC